MSALTREQYEASCVLSFFADATDGEAVMDGAGVIWHKAGRSWVSGEARPRQVSTLALARALNPDIAEHMNEEAT